MIKHGKLLLQDYDPNKIQVRNLMSDYFDNPTMTKIKDVNNYSMYATKINSGLGNSHRYLILFINTDNVDTGLTMKMSELKWISLQTRTMEENYRTTPHSYIVGKNILRDVIVIEDRKPECSIYSCESLNINLTLLHTKKDTMFQYGNRGTIASALETYQTIINLQ